MRILFYCSDTNIPSGGVKHIYKQVDILNSAGYEAYVLHTKKKFRCTWFNNTTNILYKEKNKFDQIINSDDIVVVTEIHTKFISQIPALCIIFNLNSYYMFNRWGYTLNKNNRLMQKNIAGMITISRNNKEYIELLQPSYPVYLLPLGIDTTIYQKPDFTKKQNYLSFLVNKNIDDIEQVIQILRMRNKINNIDKYKLAPINNFSESKTAKTLQKSKYYFNFALQEGLGLLPLEAIACGCIVVGYTGLAGDEFFQPQYTFPVPTLNIIQFVKQAEKALTLSEDNQQKISKKAIESIQKTYSWDQYTQNSLSMWKNIIKTMK